MHIPAFFQIISSTMFNPDTQKKVPFNIVSDITKYPPLCHDKFLLLNFQNCLNITKSDVKSEDLAGHSYIK